MNKKNILRALLLLLAALLLTFMAAFNAHQNAETKAIRDYLDICNEIVLKIRNTVRDQAQFVRFGSSFIESADTITRRNWKIFVEQSDFTNELPGIQPLGYAIIIMGNQLQSHIQRIRKEGIAEYTVKPQGEWPLSTSVIYVEPFIKGNLDVFGYDMFSEPVRRKAMETARDSDKVVLTGKVILEPKTDKEPHTGVLMYAPVYRDGYPSETVAQRRAAIGGWTFSVYRIDDLIQGILGRWDINKQHIHIQIYDEQVSDLSKIYDSHMKGKAGTIDATSRNQTILIEVNGRKWILNFEQLGVPVGQTGGTELITLIGGLLISILSSLLYLSLLRTNSDAKIMAENLTKDLKIQNEALNRLNSEKNKFFSIIAHDLRGPLGGIRGLTEIMADESNEFTKQEIKEMTFDLSRAASNTFNLLENLLEWSQIDQGLTEFKLEKPRLINVVTECRNIAAEPARGKAIELIVDIQTDQEVFADQNMLQTVIRNLLSNAIKFTPKGGRVTISAKPAENMMTMISVEDTGIGMSDQLRNDLFNMAENTKRPGTDGEKSTGLGLLLCKEFVEKSGGKIWVASEQNKGTVFSFTISSDGEPEEKNVAEEVVKIDNTLKRIDNLKILIAEDDEISAKLISVMVKGLCREVLHAQKGNEAVQICITNPDIDLIMMDIAMPGLDGYEATRRIRQFNQEVVIIVQTSFAFHSDYDKAIAAGCNDFIAKPFSKEALVELIKKYVSEKKKQG